MATAATTSTSGSTSAAMLLAWRLVSRLWRLSTSKSARLRSSRARLWSTRIPDLPVLGLPHQHVDQQQDDADGGEARQVVALDEAVDGHADQVGVGQVGRRVEQHQPDAGQRRAAIRSEVGAEAADKAPVEAAC